MLQISGVSKRFDGRRGGVVTALERIDLDVARGEIVSLVGTSGCGKSTLLRIVGGLDSPTTGRVRIDGRAVAGPSPDVGFIFQEPRLMPWLSVRENA
jgi:ABC-type nitrate/sulfonate/bicarbonate transport system ATPase subunit